MGEDRAGSGKTTSPYLKAKACSPTVSQSCFQENARRLFSVCLNGMEKIYKMILVPCSKKGDGECSMEEKAGRQAGELAL